MQASTAKLAGIRAMVMGAAAGVALAIGAFGCVSVKAPERIEVNRRERVDASQVPPTSSHEEARQRLAEAYAEIRHLRAKVADLEEDKAELRRELDRRD